MNLEKYISLKNLNTFKIDVYAKYFATFKSIDEINELFASKELQTSNFELRTLILGGGSNFLFTKNIDGVVLKNEIAGIEKIKEDKDYIYIKAGAGENWHSFVLHCLQHDYAGVENLALIPGNVGASPMQNIGAYGVEIKDVFHSLEAFDMGEKKLIVFEKTSCAFGYRESIFKNKYRGRFIIASVTYKLSKKPVFNTSYGAIEAELDKMKVSSLSIQSIAQAVINIRSNKLPDPKIIGNAGSFFKNPEVPKSHFEKLKNDFSNIIGYQLDNGNIKLAAGWLIEQCGPENGISWRGYRKGDAGCHEKQALVLVNYGNAIGEEILQLSEKIIDSVKLMFDVELHREVNIV